MDRLQNPFRPGAGAPPPALIGRDSLIDDFGVAMRRAMDGLPGQNLIVVGLRGVGKTVLLNRFQEIAQSEGMKIGFIEVPESAVFRRHLAVCLRSILLELDTGPVSSAVKKALSVLKAFTLQLPDGTTIGIDIEPSVGKADPGLLEEDLTDLIVATGEAARDRDSGVFLAIDELQYLGEHEFGALISAMHRSVQLNLPVVLAGAGLPQLPALAGNAKS